MAQVVGGRYELTAHLGGGELSEISLARPTAPNAPAHVVIKRLKLGADAEPDDVARFAAEATLVRRLDHPNIVKVIDAGEDAEIGPFLVLEHVDGQTLARIGSRARRKGDGVPRAIAVQILKEVTAGLAYAHALTDDAGKPLKLVHREVSPDNILVAYDGSTKLIDFGVAMAVASAKRRARALEGNVAYMAPEQAQSGVMLDARADVFATGIVLWELLAGKRLWEGLSEAEVVSRLNDLEPLPSVRSVAPDVPSELDEICARALAKVRDDRFDSAVELLEELEKVTKKYPELKTTPGEVGEFVSARFEEERDKMRSHAAQEGPAPSERSLPRFGSPTARGAVADVESNPQLPLGGPSTPRTQVVEVVRVEAPASSGSDRRFVFGVGGAVLIAFAALAVVAIRSGNQPATEKAEEPWKPPPPRPTVSAAPAASWVEPTEITVDISVTPSTANLYVDGVKVTVPHRVRVVPGKFPHDVRAEAEGYESRSMTAIFDRDRSIEIALTPVSKP